MRFKKDLLEALCEAAKSTYPDEFIALLSVKKDKELVEEFVAVPATFGKNFSSYRLDLLPIDLSIAGTIHSHPSRNANPSNADLHAFARGKVNLIIPFPFEVQGIKAFDNSGKPVELVIE
jgi:proteasome lid subunit RPN8/RPN11